MSYDKPFEINYVNICTMSKVKNGQYRLRSKCLLAKSKN